MVRINLKTTVRAITIFILFTTIFIYIYFTKLEGILDKSKFLRAEMPHEEEKKNYCEVIHIGLVCVTQSDKINVYTLLKSIFFYRNNPLHFHIVVSTLTSRSIRKLLESWAVPQVMVSYYNLEDIDLENVFSDSLSVLKIILPRLIDFKDVTEIILLSTDIVLNEDIYELWQHFNQFNKDQVIGIPLGTNRNLNERINADVVLYHLKNLQTYGWEEIWSLIKNRHVFEYNEFPQIQLIMGFFITLKLHYVLSCDWDSRRFDCDKVVSYQIKSKTARNIISLFESADGNLVRKHNANCGKKVSVKKNQRPITDSCFHIPDSDIHQRRTLLYAYKYFYEPTKSDVTLISQLSIDKLDLMEEFAIRWKGPISFSLYLTDVEYIKFTEFIKNSEVLKNRLDIGYHIVFKYGAYYHINYLRNVALREVNSPYVFIDDIDLVPMKNLYEVLKLSLRNTLDMNKKALVVPAFETKKLDIDIPYDMKELTEMLEKRELFIVQEDTRPEGHRPTNYTKWMSAEEPYLVKWRDKYEPYVVVKSDVIEYDERFFGYGWDKISHIMEIEAQGYQFYVLPKAFIVHKFHKKSNDKVTFLTSRRYKMCLKSIKEQSVRDLKSKYGRTFLLD